MRMSSIIRAGQLAAGSGVEQKVLIVFAVFAAAHAGAEQTQVPGGAHAAMAQLAAQKAQIAGQKVAGVFGFVGKGLDRRHQLAVHPFVGIQVQLPGPGDGQIIDRPIALRSVMLKSVLNHRGSQRARQLHGAILAVGVHNEDLVGDLAGAHERGAERFFGVEG